MSTVRRRRVDAGFTLIELLIAMSLSVIIVGVVVTAFVVTLKSTKQTRTALGESHDTQLVAAYLPADLLSAGGATSDVDSTPSTVTGCAGSPGGNYNVVRLRWSDTFGVSPTYFSTAYRVVNASGEWQLIRYACQAGTAGGLSTATASSLVVAHNLKPVVTSADLPTVALSGDQVSLTITDATGYTYVIVGARRTPLVGATASATPSPTPSPTPLQATVQSVTLSNTDALGNVQLKAVFSRPLESTCNTQFTVTDASLARAYGGTATLDATKKIATLPLTTSDLTTANTGTGGLSVAFAADRASCTAASFASAVITDSAAPVITNITTTNHTGGSVGLIETADTISVSFSETVAATSTPAGVSEVGDNGSGGDALRLTGWFAADANLGSTSYITNNNKTATFPATSAVSGATVTLTLGAYSCSGGSGSCPILGSGGPGTLTYLQASTLADVAGNTLTSTGMTATPRTISTFRAF